MKAVLVIGAIAMVCAFPSAAASTPQVDVQLIAYERWVGDGSPDYEIWVMETDGSRQRKLADGCCFSWSPDGRAIAFHTEGEISRINVDGTELRRLTSGSIHQRPTWAPDGKRIVYAEKDGLFVNGATGGNSRRITRGDDFDPDWSPNGRKLPCTGFSSARSGSRSSAA